MRFFFIVLILSLRGNLSFASFEQNTRRYMSYYDVMTSMKNIFVGDLTLVYGDVQADCIVISDNNRVDLGYNNAATGEPGTSSPNPNYIRWIKNCISSYMGFVQYKDINNSLLVSAKVKLFFEEKFKSQGYQPPLNLYLIGYINYNNLPEEIQNDLIDYAFTAVFGPEEAFNQFNLLDAKNYKATVKAHLISHNYTAIKALEVIMLNYLMRDEFLSY